MYINGEDGFRCKRNALGEPIRASFEVSTTSPTAIINNNNGDSKINEIIKTGDGTIVNLDSKG